MFDDIIAIIIIGIILVLAIIYIVRSKKMDKNVLAVLIVKLALLNE